MDHLVVRDLGQDGVGVGGVDAGDLAGFVVADEEAVVVGQAGELVDFKHGDTLAPFGSDWEGLVHTKTRRCRAGPKAL